jgi:hypothetical protein
MPKASSSTVLVKKFFLLSGFIIHVATDQQVNGIRLNKLILQKQFRRNHNPQNFAKIRTWLAVLVGWCAFSDLNWGLASWGLASLRILGAEVGKRFH